MSAGRHPGSDILLDDITVSRHHAEFRIENGQFRIVDAGSLNGTYVNRQPVDSAVLANGDEIQIGTFRLVFFTNLTDGPGASRRWPSSGTDTDPLRSDSNAISMFVRTSATADTESTVYAQCTPPATVASV
jgi:pSer/pThr/pTyr-binding forkhead associated (FHA) protein